MFSFLAENYFIRLLTRGFPYVHQAIFHPLYFRKANMVGAGFKDTPNSAA
jgi:hypothetical protein